MHMPGIGFKLIQLENHGICIIIIQLLINLAISSYRLVILCWIIS